MNTRLNTLLALALTFLALGCDPNGTGAGGGGGEGGAGGSTSSIPIGQSSSGSGVYCETDHYYGVGYDTTAHAEAQFIYRPELVLDQVYDAECNLTYTSIKCGGVAYIDACFNSCGTVSTEDVVLEATCVYVNCNNHMISIPKQFTISGNAGAYQSVGCIPSQL